MVTRWALQCKLMVPQRSSSQLASARRTQILPAVVASRVESSLTERWSEPASDDRTEPWGLEASSVPSPVMPAAAFQHVYFSLALLKRLGSDSAVASVPCMHAAPPRHSAQGRMEWLPYCHTAHPVHASISCRGRRGLACLIPRSKPHHALLTYKSIDSGQRKTALICEQREQ